MAAQEPSPIIAAVADPAGKPRRVRRLARWVLAALVLFVALMAFTLLYNNFSLRSETAAQFNAEADRALNGAINWILRDPPVSMRNPSVMYMVADMESMSHDPRLTRFLKDYRESMYLRYPSSPIDFVWSRLVDPGAKVPLVTPGDLEHIAEERRWDAYGIAPEKVQLTYDDRGNMFSPTKYIWGARHHQLLALIIYRHFNGGSPELDQTINHLAEKIARDAHYDFRVSDSYVQRTTFILAAGRPDLVRRRWVDRILENQNTDGSWSYCWYEWCRGVFEFHKYNPGHPTVQAAWALTLLKYRYPQWAEEHYR